jgi:hypothetical protein
MGKKVLYFRDEKAALQSGDILIFEIKSHCFSIVRDGDYVRFGEAGDSDRKRFVYGIGCFNDFYELCLLLGDIGDLNINIICMEGDIFKINMV